MQFNNFRMKKGNFSLPLTSFVATFVITFTVRSISYFSCWCSLAWLGGIGEWRGGAGRGVGMCRSK
uniref:Hypothetical secreted peptide n=1 Tax=Glossina morsitans morsitans TaxID=37546 RepID=D3TSR7_GLOMM